MAIVAAMVAGGAAPALGDGPTGLRLVGRGISPGGQRWVQSARADHGHIIFEIEFPPIGDAGGIGSGPLTPKFKLFAGRGSGFGVNKDEYEVDGFVYRTVHRVRVTTVRRTVTFRARRAPKRALARWPQLARARFFVRFFQADDRPTRIEALDAHGKVLAWEPGVSEG